MSDEIRLRYVPREDASPEGERAALAAVYRFLLDRHIKTKGGSATAPEARKLGGLSTTHIGPQEETPMRNEPNNPQ